MPRRLIERALGIAEEVSRRREALNLIVEAPTGYGKTVGGPLLYSVLAKELSVTSFLHVLPLRAVVRDFYACVLLAALTGSPYRDCRRSPAALAEVERALRAIGVGVGDVAYQMGEAIVGEHARREPLFDARYVVTTLDSFVYNLFRVPVTEIFSPRKHYAIPRLRIFLSAVYLDEAHTVFEESEEESTMYTAAMKALRVLKAFRVPLALVSATLGALALNEVRGELREAVVIRLGTEDREGSNVVEVSDPDFVSAVEGIRWKTNTLRDGEVVEHVVDRAERGYRVFLALDSVKRAVEKYRKLSERLGRSNVVLIHGFMTQGDRDEALKRVRGARVLVATSVVEAGVDFSFDVLVSDGLRARSVIQRCGRVCRHVDEAPCEEAEVSIVEDHSSRELLEFVKRAQERGREVCWRLPFDAGEYVGYGGLLNRVKPPRRDEELWNLLKALALPLIVSGNTINFILREANYSLVRVGLVEAVVGEVGELEGLSYADILSRSLTLPSYRVKMLLESGCITSLAALYGDGGITKAKPVCYPHELSDFRGGFSFRQYLRCRKRAAEAGEDLLSVVLTIDSVCYEPGVGVKVEQVRGS